MTRQAADVAVPLLDLKAQYQPIRNEIVQAILRVCDSQRFILGPEVDAFEAEMAARLGVEHAVAVSSGTDAVLVALMALGIGPGAEVITPTYSFFGTAGSVARLGATPVFVDIDPVTMNVDPAALARAVTPKTRAIMPVHLFGLPAEMDSLLAVARRAGVPLVEDAAQAIGARYHGRTVGGLGAVGCFSFFPSKNLGAYGDGGLVTTNDRTLADEIRLLRNHGMEPKYVHSRIGGNFRLDALQAAVLRVKAPYLDEWTNGRRRNADRYRTLFEEFDLADRLELPVEPEGYRHIYHQYVIRGSRRNALKEFLATRQIGTEIYYPVPFHRQECFRDISPSDVTYPVADRAAETSLALPIYSELTPVQQRHVVASIAEFYGSRGGDR